MIHLSGLLPEEINERLDFSKAFRGTQLFEALHSGVSTIDAITTLPKELRRSLKERALIFSTILHKRISDSDGSTKYQIALPDGFIVESVLLRDNKNRKTACLSTQAGCAVGCAFCKTGTLGLHRNLSTGEMVEQLLHMNNLEGPVSNIVFMGMGEPLLNLERLIKTIEVLLHPKGQGLSSRRMTISTVGIPKRIRELADTGLNPGLALSLQSAIQEKREELIPLASNYPLADVKRALTYYQEKTGNRITLEYVLLKGINDSEKDIAALKKFLPDLPAMVNLIPWNPVEGLPFKEAGEKDIQDFMATCKKHGIPLVRRYRRGRGVKGACGQLGGYAKEEQCG